MANDDDVIAGILAAPDVGDDDIISGILSAPDVDGGGSAAGESAADESSPVVLTTPDGKQQRRFSRVNIDSEYALANALGYTAASAKITDKGAAGFLEEKLGRGRVFQDEQGSVFVIPEEQFDLPPEQQVPVVLNAPGISKADIAVGAGFASAGPLLASGAGALGLGKGAALAATGAIESVAQQALSAVAPGEDDLSGLERGAHLLLSAGLSRASPALGEAITSGVAGAAKAAGKVFRPIRTAQDFAQSMAIRGSEGAVATGAELSERLKADFSLGQLTGKEGVSSVEEMLRPIPFIGSPIEQQRKRIGFQLKQAADRLVSSLGTNLEDASATAKAAVNLYGKELDRFGSALRSIATTDGREGVAKSVVASLENAYLGLQDARRTATRPLFAKVKAASKGKVRINVIETAREMGEIYADNASEMAPGKQDAIATWMNNMLLKNLGTRKVEGIKQIRMDPVRFHNMLSHWGKAAAFPKGVIPGLDDDKAAQAIASRLYGAIMRDLDNAVKALPEEVGADLKVARDAYREMSIPINEFMESPLRKVTAEPEKFISRMLTTDGSAGQRSLMGLVNKYSPAFAVDVKRAALGQMVGNAKEILPGVPHPGALSRVSKRYGQQIDVLFEGDSAGKAAWNGLVSKSRKLAGNPLLKFVDNEDALLRAFHQKDNPAALKEIVGYIRAARPDVADKLSGRFMQSLFEKAVPLVEDGAVGTLDEVVSADRLRSVLRGNWQNLNIALAGNSAAKDGLNDLLAGLRVAGRGSGAGKSPTQTRQAISSVVGKIGTFGAGFAVAAASTAQVVTAMFSGRVMARALAEPNMAAAYKQIYKASAQPKLLKNSAFRSESERALGVLLTWGLRNSVHDMTDEASPSQNEILNRAMSFAPAAL